jgi:uncharacterized protein YcbK (DUF882 family)
MRNRICEVDSGEWRRHKVPLSDPGVQWMYRLFQQHGKKLAVSTAAAIVLLGTGSQSRAVEGGSGSSAAGERYVLHLHHLHTGEDLDVVYRIGNTYVPGALEKLNYFLRDHRTNDVSHYDPKEFDVLHAVLAKLGRPDAVIDVICGYRTPWSNNYLRTRASVTGVAQHSQHMLAKAIDIRIPGVSTARLRDAALSLKAGGVGYYPISQFVHVDVGPVRQWSFSGSGE